MKTKLQYKIAVPIAVVIFVINVTSFFIVRNMSKRSIEQQLEEQVDSATDSIKILIEEKNKSEFISLDIMATIPAIRDPDVSLREKTDIIDGIVTNCSAAYYDMGIIGLDGKSIKYHSNETRDFSDKIFFKEALKGKGYVMHCHNKVL